MSTSDSPLTFVLDHPSLSIDQARLHNHLLSICETEGYTVDELSIVFTTHEVVRAINKQYLNHDYNTDVIAFQFAPSHETHLLEGEIYVDLDMAQERCEEFGVTFEAEAFRYAIHGLLHLMNYSDKTPEKLEIMKARESAYLSSLLKS